MGSICTSDLHIKHGSVPRAVPGITVGHEMVGVVAPIVADAEDKPLFMDGTMEKYQLEDVQYCNGSLWLNYKR